MRTRTRWVAALALSAATGLAACGGQDLTGQLSPAAPGGTGTGQSCLEAINVASFMPNFADPQQAKADARVRMDELAQLTARTSDSTLRQDLIDVHYSVGQVASGEISLDTSSDWTNAQAESYQEVTTTCSQAAATD
ncbi:hypothetical protein IQ251_11720 [Saccharopolyspora sp. HNM0983]|uniref:Lipoprotein n=1 Tax=Saccharopolyspora montiporae TaxID=2781240 RepID=A0A929G012_9PSEU|nr:hypothetical protein [Saccharopolyspora sp. HNM0983]MBE9375110.1 hypothetical protein [Saccharopolyspora sp. HNM0983]